MVAKCVIFIHTLLRRWNHGVKHFVLQLLLTRKKISRHAKLSDKFLNSFCQYLKEYVVLFFFQGSLQI
jgi:regulator of sigma D